MKEFISDTKIELIHIACFLIVAAILLSSCRTVKKSMERTSIKSDSVSIVNRELLEVSNRDSTGSTLKIDTSASSIIRDYETLRTVETFTPSELFPLLTRETIYSRGKETEQSRSGKSEFSESQLSRKDSTVAAEQSKTEVSIKQNEVVKNKETKGVPLGTVAILAGCFLLLIVAVLMMRRAKIL